MSDSARTGDPEPAAGPPAQQSTYAQPVTQAPGPAPAGHGAPAQPSFIDRVLGMRAVIAVVLAALVIGGLTGFILGEHTGGGDDRFGPGPAGFPGGPQSGFGQHGRPQPGRPMR
jgi:hypothetical protein